MNDSGFEESLQAARSSGERTMDALFSQLYREIRREAGRLMALEGPGCTLQSTELVHAAFLRLRDHRGVVWQGRLHFLRTAAKVMRQVLVDQARKRRSLKRGGEGQRVTLGTLERTTPLSLEDVIAVHRALQTLEEQGGSKGRGARALDLAFFAGATMPEIAEILGVTERQIYRDYNYARTWLKREIGV